MIPPNNRWLINTILIGLIPVLARLLTWTVARDNINLLAPPDFITLGLVVHISLINELARAHTPDHGSKVLLNAISLMFVTLYGTLYALTIIAERNPELIDTASVLKDSFLLCTVSIAFGLVLFRQLSSRRPS